MNKKFKYFTLPILFCLASCGINSNNIFDYNAYNRGVFKLNYYDIFDSRLKGDKVLDEEIYYVNPIKGLDNLETKVFNTTLQKDEFYKKDSTEYSEENKLIWTQQYSNYSKTAPNGNEEYFGATNSIAFGRNGDSSFAKGIISKLYDGRISCSGKYAESRVQIAEQGFGTTLPKQIKHLNYLSISLRGGTDFDELQKGSGVIESLGFNHVIDLKVTLYKKELVNNTYKPYSFVMNDLPIVTDNQNELTFVKEDPSNPYSKLIPTNDSTIGSSGTHCISIFFMDAKDENNNPFNLKNLEGVAAYSITYTLHPTSRIYNGTTYDIVTDPNADAIHYGLLLYEIMMPEVIWR